MTDDTGIDTGDDVLLRRIETFYDAVPRRRARVEEHGSVRLFVAESGWPYYARPAAPDVTVEADALRTVLERMADLGVPREVEWLHTLTPSMGAAAEAAGLAVTYCPLMVLDGLREVPAPAGLTVELVRPDDDHAVIDAVAHVAFGAGGTAVGEPGVADRDALAEKADPDRVANARDALAAGAQVKVVALGDEGPVGVGSFQHTAGVAEVVGVATLPTHRRRGIAAAVTALLCREALAAGDDVVFLSAQDEDVARVYAQVGFRRVGTAGLAEPAS